ncbi:putative membrane protein (TIGR04086 family) [Scopulibacillus daqui]|uniref:Membrane protein (TIGR04086 family) n=1 Tax=Scopulibacillus daqui TaxID=1469162 RepID=A0ABS2PXN4_9BACL|nr:putative membrane protein (TIGR04086 family) [Scopulibacillus daqui]
MTRRILTAACYGIVTALLVILVVTCVLATLLRFTSITESSIGLLPIIASFAALFIAGIIAGAKMKEKGLFIGGTTGVLYSLLILLIQFLGYNSGVSHEEYLIYGGNIFTAALGGVVGVNLFNRKY